MTMVKATSEGTDASPELRRVPALPETVGSGKSRRSLVRGFEHPGAKLSSSWPRFAVVAMRVDWCGCRAQERRFGRSEALAHGPRTRAARRSRQRGVGHMGTSQALTIRIEARSDVMRVALSGELDIATVPIPERPAGSLGARRLEGDPAGPWGPELHRLDSPFRARPGIHALSAEWAALPIGGREPEREAVVRVTGTEFLLEAPIATQLVGLFTETDLGRRIGSEHRGTCLTGETRRRSMRPSSGR